MRGLGEGSISGRDGRKRAYRRKGETEVPGGLLLSELPPAHADSDLLLNVHL